MAVPTILVDSATGSDTAASGAGPATALTGTAAATDAAGTVVTLDGSPDLSGVATDGSHVLFLLDSTAGARNFGPITAVDNVAKTVTVGNAFRASASGLTWAIGGKRASIFADNNSRKLAENNSAAGDALAGWTIQLASGHTETRNGAVTFRRSGSSTTGPITLQGEPGATTLPLITFSNNGDGIVVSNGLTYLVFQDFELRNSNATKTASVAIDGFGGQFVVRRVKIAHSTDKFWKGILSMGVFEVDGAEIGYCANIGIHVNYTFPVTNLWNLYVHHCGSHGISVQQGFISLWNSIVAYNSGDGVNAATGNAFHVVINNTFYGNTGDGWESTTTVGNLERSVWFNNLFAANGGYGLRFSGAGVTAALLDTRRVRFQGNLFYNNTSGKYNISGMLVEGESLDNPDLADPTNHDYTPSFAIVGEAFPTGKPVGAPLGNSSAALTYGYPGAVQRLNGARATMLLAIGGA